MSSDIANIPPWKVALMEQKRRRQEPSSDGKQDQVVDMTGLPAWKQEVIAKKQQQRNSTIFVARPATRDTELDSTVSHVANGHDINKRRSCMPKLDLSSIQQPAREPVETTQHNSFDDRPMEERLLPIHRNPILRNDLQKRHSSSGSQRNSWSPRSGTESSHSSSGSHTRHSMVEGMKTPSPEILPSGDNYGDVFGTDESEVTYGKGFVHKLLVKFSNLSVSELAASNRQSVGSNSTSPSYNHVKAPYVDAESVSVKPHQSSPRAKYHSVDDLLSESNSQQSAFSVPNGDSKLMNGGIESYNGSTPNLSSIQRRASLSEDEDLPLQNIVSNTRSMFEHLSSTSSRCRPVSVIAPSAARTTGVSNNRFSFVGLADKAPPKVAENQHSSAAIKVDQMKPDEEAGKKMHSEVAVSQKSNGIVKSVSEGNIGTVVYGGDTSVKGGNSLPIKFPTSSNSSYGYDVDSSVKDENDNSSKLTMPVKRSGASPANASSKALEISKPAVPMHLNGEIPGGSLSSDIAIKNDADLVPNASVAKPSSNTTHTTALTSQTAVSKSSAVMSNSFTKPEASASSNNHSTAVEPERPLRSQTPVSGNRAAPSRPGKLLIRPASNLLASKTNTEYLSLTKYNDVRKGEFAPAARKPVDDVADDDTVDAYEVSGSTELPANNCVSDKFEFSGAGIKIGRSLLDKTKQGRRLSINFNDAQTATFEYPSEQSLMDATPAQPGDCDYEGETPDYGSSAGLRSAPISGNSAAALSSYRSRMQVDYQFGMHMEEKPKPEPLPVPTAVKSTTPDPAKSADKPDSPLWSKGASSDLLF